MATVYAVASAKGGVGKTTTTAAIATVLAESGADVVAIDADVGMANLADALGMVPGETTIHDVLAGRADPTEVVHDGPAGLRVVPGDPDLDAYAAADPTELGGVVEAFADADYVFLDAGAGLSHDSTLPIGLADETLLVSTPDRTALGDTEKTRQLAERIGGHVAGAAITRVGGDEDDPGGSADAEETADSNDPTVDIVDEILATRVLARIPEDPTVARASAAGEPLSTFDPNAPASRAYRELARTLTGADVAEPGSAGEKPVADTDEEDDDAEEDEDAAETNGDDDAGDDDPVSKSEDALIGDAEETEDAEEDEDLGADVSGDAAEDVDDGELGIGGDEEGPGDGDRTELIEEAEAGPGDAADADGDDGSGGVDDDGSEDASDGDDAHDEDDLEGSVPFRDDDTGTMETALTGADDGDRSADDDDGGSRESDGDRKEDDGGDEKRGFFSRLLGR